MAGEVVVAATSRPIGGNTNTGSLRGACLGRVEPAVCDIDSDENQRRYITIRRENHCGHERRDVITIRAY